MKKPNMFAMIIFILAISSIVFAQSTIIDFETGGNGADWTWVVDQNGTNPALLFPANPVSGGINTTATVAQFTAEDAGQDWALCYTDDIEPFEFDATNTTVSIMVYKPVISDVAIKFEIGSVAAEVHVANTLINQWELLTFDFSGYIGSNYGRIVIIPDFAPRDQNNLLYFDNIQIPEGNIAPPAEPTVPAPIPTENPADVISIFSDTYTDLPGTNFNPPWGQTTVVTIPDIGGNSMLKYASFNYQGTQLSGNQDLSSMDYMHIDMWTENATLVKVTPISASTGEHLVSIGTIVPETWNSYDIPLSAFTGVSKTDIMQLKFDGQAGVTPSTIFLDNIYFYSSAAPGTDATLSDLRVDGATIPGFSPAIFSYVVELTSGGRVPVITATTNDPNATKVITQASVIPGTATVVVTAEDETTTLTYSIYFTLEGAAPTDSPPIPTEDPTDVISIYSDAYANVPGTNYNPDWGQSTIVTVDELIDGNNTLKYENLNYQGTEYTNQDVSGYECLHVDFWTANSTDLGIYLISPGNEREYVFTIAYGEWVSVDIPLTDFVPPVNLANVFQFKVEGNGDIWFDNLYFWKNPTAQGTDATLSDLKVDGMTINGFAPLTENYTYGLLEGTVIVPQITEATTTDPNANRVINQASAIPGAATVVVTAEDGITTKTYTVNFAITIPNSVPPIPSHDPGNVISMFSDSYTDVAVDTWLTPWSQGVLEDIMVLDNPVKKYTAVNFAGIETVGPNLIDVSGMTHIHLDLWTPDANDFKIKLVDWGADAAWSGGDDTEYELIFPAPVTGSWISYDIPLSSFTGLNITGHMAQYILSKGPLGTMYIDNMYFYNAALDIPANVTVTQTSSEITISWDSVAGANSYIVYSSDDPYGTYTPVTGGSYNGTSWTNSISDSAKFYYVTASSE